MPELPEIETIRRDLAPALVGASIVSASLHRADVLVHVGGPRRSTAAAMLDGCHLTSIERRGKALGLVTREGPCLQIHLGMSGQLLMPDVGRDRAMSTHVHAEWTFSNAKRLLYRDPRRFGSLTAFADRAAMNLVWNEQGPDALAISASALATALAGTRSAIKAVLLDQHRLAGVGNIYADEALHEAKIHPARPTSTLSADELKRLADALQFILRRAVNAGGTTRQDYRRPNGSLGTAQEHHRVYGLSGKPCKGCTKGRIQTLRIAGRTSHFCAFCQPTGKASRSG